LKKGETANEIMQFFNYRLNSKTLTTQEITNWLECDKQDRGFEILNDDQIISNVIAVEEVDDDVEESELNQKPIRTTQKQKQCYLSASTDLKYKKRQMQRRSYFSVKYGTLSLKKFESRKNRRR